MCGINRILERGKNVEQEKMIVIENDYELDKQEIVYRGNLPRKGCNR